VLVLAKDRTVRRYKAAAETDALTGLYNRRGFFEGASTLIAAHRGKTAPVSVIVFDLDHFKSINDRFGHDTGDAMLGLFARVIRRTMRADDVIGRLGGEEFVAILSGTPAEAGIAAERVRAAFEAATNGPESLGIPATVSAGVASGLAEVAVDHLIARADSFLYQAKAKGRNRVERDDNLVTPAVPRPDAGRCDVRRPVASALPGIQVAMPVSLPAPMPAR
jgi:diguanylate cyclase (GGDEF)-like protein